jgi:hypothetical protein
MTRRRDRNRNRGSMPFAFAAVALLLAVSAYGVVAAGVEDAEDGERNSEMSMAAVEAAADGVSAYIEQGMGETVRTVSVEKNGGGLDQRRERFGVLMDRWMDTMFPRIDSGVRVTLNSYDIRLSVEDLRTTDGMYAADGCTPAYLFAEGTADLTFESDAGKVRRTVDLQADGSCALPLALGRGTMFQSLLEGDGSMLTQMMQYQLASLAETRVMNGYGIYAGGDKGTAGIITRDDVREAYDTALRAAETVVFRDADGEIVGGTRDIGMDLVRSRGGLEVSLSDMYAQVAAGAMDKLVGKWFDYFLGSEILGMLDGVADKLADAWDSLVSFLTGKETDYSAAPYIEEVTGRSDFSIDGEFTITFPSPKDGVREMSFTVPYPHTDLLHYGAIEHFKKDYRENTDGILEWIKSVANGALSQIAEEQSMGTAFIEDRGTFAESLRAFAVENAGRCDADFLEILRARASSSHCPDPFYAAIYETIEENKADIFCTDPERILSGHLEEFREQLMAAYLEDTGNDIIASLAADRQIKNVLSFECNQAQFREYSVKVDEVVYGLRALCDVEKRNSTVIQEGCAHLLKLPLIATSFDTEARFVEMADEFAGALGADPFEGWYGYGEEGDFVLNGEKPGREKLTVEVDSDPSVTVTRNSGASSHNTKLNSYGADFCSVFTVNVTDCLTFTVTGTGGLQSMMGEDDCAFRATVPVDLTTDVPVVSGLPLAGFEYSTTENFADDVWKEIAELGAKLIEPLIQFIRTVGELGEKFATAVSELLADTQLIEELYNLLTGRTAQLADTIARAADDAFGSMAFQLAGEAREIIDIKASQQTVGFEYMGWTVTFTVDIKKLDSASHDALKVCVDGTLGGAALNTWLTVSEHGGDYSTRGGFGYGKGDWGIEGTVNPSMYRSDRIVTVDGHYGDTDFSVSIPEVSDYRELEVRLTDIPCLEPVLSNLPSPVPGTKMSVDAGAELKYSVPLDHGVIVNEVESNPDGEDKGREWAEILNFSGTEADLDGMWLETSRGKTYPLDGTLAPMERKVFEFAEPFLNNRNESLMLKDSDGTVDSTPEFSDSDNDDTTYQRIADGCTHWGHSASTQGEQNSGLFSWDGIVIEAVKDIVKDAAAEALDEAGHVTDMVGLSLLCQNIALKVMDTAVAEISGFLVEARLFVECEVSDATGSACAGFQAYIGAGQPAAESFLKYLFGKAAQLFLDVEDPYGVDLSDATWGGIYVGAEAFTGLGAPDFVPNHDSMEAKASIDVRANLEAVNALLGGESHTAWEVDAGLVFRDCPAACLPDAGDHPEKMDHDLWLMRIRVSGGGD